MDTRPISDIKDRARELCIESVKKFTEELRKALVGKRVYKYNGKDKPNVDCGIIKDIYANYFTEYNDVNLTICTDKRTFNTYGVNLHDRDLQFGYFYE